MDTMKEMGVVAEIALMFARIWGVRAMVRIINPIRRNLLAKVEQRLTIEFNKSGHCIRTDLNYRPIHFEIKVDNPIPIDLHITEYKCEIYYRTMLILPDARLTEDVPRLVKREAKSDRLYVEYNPITQRLGIPRDPNGWELRC